MVWAHEVKTQCVEKDSEALSGFSRKDCENGSPVSAMGKAWANGDWAGRSLRRLAMCSLRAAWEWESGSLCDRTW